MENNFKNRLDEASIGVLSSPRANVAATLARESERESAGQSAGVAPFSFNHIEVDQPVRAPIPGENSVFVEPRDQAVVASTVYLALGSNIGDRLLNLREACDRLSRHPNLQIEAKSRVYETQSVDSGGDAAFLNAALRVSWNGSASSLLRCTQSVEERMGRPKPPRSGPRLIDIDILLFGDAVVATPQLTVPHPRMGQRAFVLRPLCDVLEEGWVREFSLGNL